MHTEPQQSVTQQMIIDLHRRLEIELAQHATVSTITNDELHAASTRLVESLLAAQQSIFDLLGFITDPVGDDTGTVYDRLRRISDPFRMGGSSSAVSSVIAATTTAARIVAIMDTACHE